MFEKKKRVERHHRSFTTSTEGAITSSGFPFVGFWTEDNETGDLDCYIFPLEQAEEFANRLLNQAKRVREQLEKEASPD